MANRYHLTRDEAVEAVTKTIDMIYENKPKEFEINISAGVDQIPLIRVSFEGIMIKQIMGENQS